MLYHHSNPQSLCAIFLRIIELNLLIFLSSVENVIIVVLKLMVLIHSYSTSHQSPQGPPPLSKCHLWSDIQSSSFSLPTVLSVTTDSPWFCRQVRGLLLNNVHFFDLFYFCHMSKIIWYLLFTLTSLLNTATVSSIHSLAKNKARFNHSKIFSGGCTTGSIQGSLPVGLWGARDLTRAGHVQGKCLRPVLYLYRTLSSFINEYHSIVYTCHIN